MSAVFNIPGSHAWASAFSKPTLELPVCRQRRRVLSPTGVALATEAASARGMRRQAPPTTSPRIRGWPVSAALRPIRANGSVDLRPRFAEIAEKPMAFRWHEIIELLPPKRPKRARRPLIEWYRVSGIPCQSCPPEAYSALQGVFARGWVVTAYHSRNVTTQEMRAPDYSAATNGDAVTAVRDA